MHILHTYTIRYNEAEGWTELVKGNGKPYLSARFGDPSPHTIASLFRDLAKEAAAQAEEAEALSKD